MSSTLLRHPEPRDTRLRVPGGLALLAVRRLAKRYASVSSLGLAALLIAGEFLSRVQIAFTLLYLAPVALAAWWRSRGYAIAIAAVCATGAVAVNLSARLQSHRPVEPLHMLWNHGGSFLVFVAVALLVGRLREYAVKEALERRMTVEQLRQSERLGVIGKLAAGVAHELGTPLNVISGYAELLEAGRVTGPTAEKAATTILTQTRKMSAIIRGLLDFSRPAGGERSDVDLAALAKRAMAVLQPMAQKMKVEIEVDAQGDDAAVVSGNPVELEQVLVNLMVNGIQAMPEGGTLRVHVRRHAHDPNAQRGTPPAAVVCLEVEDEGTGISPESMPKIFDPFFTTKDVGEGTGLGLSVSYGIVSDHGGRIEVSSTPGSGSRFSVFLPLAKGRTMAA